MFVIASVTAIRTTEAIKGEIPFMFIFITNSLFAKQTAIYKTTTILFVVFLLYK